MLPIRSFFFCGGEMKVADRLRYQIRECVSQQKQKQKIGESSNRYHDQHREFHFVSGKSKHV